MPKLKRRPVSFADLIIKLYNQSAYHLCGINSARRRCYFECTRYRDGFYLVISHNPNRT